MSTVAPVAWGRFMGAIRRFLMAQIRKTPGEWIRAHILDGVLGLVYAHLPFAWTSIAVAALVGLTSGLLTWSRHDPGLAIFLGVLSLLAVLCVALVATVLWEKYRTRPATVPASGVSPLEIVFDLNNPGEQFWKRRQGTDANGNLIPKMVLEHRIGVRNTSSTTIRNVRVSIETLGIIPIDPRDMRFQKGDKENFDISPGHMELAPIWWVWPPEAGDAWGSTATAFHGPLRVTARGDDIYPAKAEFDYFPAQVPALVRIAESTETIEDDHRRVSQVTLRLSAIVLIAVIGLVL